MVPVAFSRMVYVKGFTVSKQARHKQLMLFSCFFCFFRFTYLHGGDLEPACSADWPMTGPRQSTIFPYAQAQKENVCCERKS